MKQDATLTEKILSSCGIPRVTVLTFCCTVLLNVYTIHLLSVHRHAHCCLISQLKWSASEPHVCFICSKISQLFVVVCSIKKKEEEWKKNKHASLHLAHVNVAITCITLMHCRVSGVSTNVIWQTGNVMKSDICRQQQQMLVNNCWVSERFMFLIFFFVRVAVKLNHIHTLHWISIITSGSALFKKKSLTV